jgi:hypothetical protein
VEVGKPDEDGPLDCDAYQWLMLMQDHKIYIIHEDDSSLNEFK